MLKVKFLHIKETEQHKACTVCVIQNKDGEQIAMGTADCSRKDQYSRRIGRKISLLRAAHTLPDLLRKEALGEWFKNHPKDAAQEVKFDMIQNGGAS